MLSDCFSFFSAGLSAQDVPHPFNVVRAGVNCEKILKAEKLMTRPLSMKAIQEMHKKIKNFLLDIKKTNSYHGLDLKQSIFHQLSFRVCLSSNREVHLAQEHSYTGGHMHGWTHERTKGKFPICN